MTETDWLTTDDFHGMGVALWRRGPVSLRALLLFLHARCRHLLELAPDLRLAGKLGLFRRHVEFGLSRAELNRLGDTLGEMVRRNPTPATCELDEAVHQARLTSTEDWFAGSRLADHLFPRRERDEPPDGNGHPDFCYLGPPAWYVPSALPRHADLPDALQADWLRDLFGNPFAPCPVTRDQTTAWLRAAGGLAAKLLKAIVDADRYVNLPILADALEEAGCDAADLLAHLRAGTPHVAGCWAVDLLAGQG